MLCLALTRGKLTLHNFWTDFAVADRFLWPATKPLDRGLIEYEVSTEQKWPFLNLWVFLYHAMKMMSFT